MSTADKQTRANRTITVDLRGDATDATYVQLLGNGKAFVECVCAFLLSLGFPLAHKATCRGGCLTGSVANYRKQESLSSQAIDFPKPDFPI